MADDIPDEAVNALAEHLWGFAPGPREAKRNMARKMLVDVYPLIAARVRADTANQIADAIEGRIATHIAAAVKPETLGMGLREAAAIARQFGDSS